MTSNPEKTRLSRRFLGGRKGLFVKVGILAAIAVAIYLPFRQTGPQNMNGTTFDVKRGDLTIAVTEGGSIKAEESQKLVCEVPGQTKILTIVDEGYQVTEQDVKDKKVLVTLDSSELEERATQQEIEYQSSLASYTEATKQYEIQIKQNESDIREAELLVKFARMDFEKYLGAESANDILRTIGLDNVDILKPRQDTAPVSTPTPPSNIAVDRTVKQDSADSEKNESGLVLQKASFETTDDSNGKQEEKGDEAGNEEGENIVLKEKENTDVDSDISISSTVAIPHPPINFMQYADPAKLGDGEAQEKLRKLQSDALLSQQELELAKTDLEGTKRLREKDFVTKQELEQDELEVARNTNSAEASRIAQELFMKYEFPKNAEKLLSDFEEALRKLDRTWQQAASELAQSEARMKSNEAKHNLQTKRRKDLYEQIDKCTLCAERTGLVVYAGSDEPWRNDRIEPGATIRERQDIITIPDMTKMSVEVKVHESSIKKVQKGQKCIIRLDSFPDRVLDGEITKVSVLPDSSQRWMNPDIKVYNVTASIGGVNEWLKPGMSADVEIMVEQLDDVIYVPIQAVFSNEGQRVCYVESALGNAERRVVEVGAFNDEYIEVQKGLDEGDTVLLRAPSPIEQKTGKGEPDKTEEAAPGSGDTESKPEQPAQADPQVAS